MRTRWSCAILTAFAVLFLGVAPAFAQSSATYTYDALGRVVTAVTSAGSTTYTYDNADNRTRVTSCVGTCNHNPIAVADSASVNSGGTVVVPVLTNDSDPDGNSLTVTAVTAGAKGTSSVTSGGGSVTYIAGAGQTGADSFTYTISDGHGGSATATVTITITAGAPVANPVSATVAFNSSGNSIPLSITGSATSVSVASGASHGTATASGLGITYTPATGYSGADSFLYRASNSGGMSSPATVSITVSAAPPAPPTAGAASATVGFNSSNNPISANLSGGTASSVAVVSSPGHGTATVSGLGFRYTPTTGYTGTDSFTYNASGPGGTSGSALVSISVLGPGAPTVAPGSMTVAFNSSGNAVPLSISGVATSVGVVANPAHGSVLISGTSMTYTPATGYSGSDSFFYFASGPGGTSGSAQITITVTPGAPSLTVGLNTTSYSGSRDPTGEHPGTPVAATPTGGTAPYSYAWSLVSGDATVAISSSTASTVTWAKAGTLHDGTFTAVWHLVVTDALGATATSANVSVEYDENTFM